MKTTQNYLRKVAACALAGALFIGGCAPAQPSSSSVPAPAASSSAPAAVSSQVEAISSGAVAGMRSFTDSAGRAVEIPATISRVAPSGQFAQLMLYTLCPELLVGRAVDYSPEKSVYLSESFTALPKFGQFYGKNADLNMEALVAADPELVIDVGQTKGSIVEDMDGLQEQLGLPVAFVEANLENMPQAYRSLGELTGTQERADKLAVYAEETLRMADAGAKAVPAEQKRKVYYAGGDNGLFTNAVGSIHGEIIERVGGVNVADVEASSRGSGSEISFEQVLGWAPDVILTENAALYELVTTDPLWAGLDAVQKGQVYRVPDAPFGFVNTPPSVNRLIGMRWLGNLLYPAQYPMDVAKEVQAFYALFYQNELDESATAKLLEQALAKA